MSRLSSLRPVTLFSLAPLLVAAFFPIAVRPAAAAEAESFGAALDRARHLLIESHVKGSIPASVSAAPLAALPQASAPRVEGNAGSGLVGTWRVHVPGEDPSQDFDALQTFHADGTFTETSSLFATLTEGPAHGVWGDTEQGTLLTFHLFGFENGVSYGRIRVRNRITLTGRNTFTATSTVDILPLGGPPVLAVATGEFTGVRLGLLAP